MTIVVEDGTGVFDAEAYSSEADYIAFVANRLGGEAVDLARFPAAIYNGMSLLSELLRGSLSGTAYRNGSPLLDFPRTNCTDIYGGTVTGVPREVILAGMLAVYYAYQFLPESTYNLVKSAELVDLIRIDLEPGTSTASKLLMDQIDRCLVLVRVFQRLAIKQMVRTA